MSIPAISNFCTFNFQQLEDFKATVKDSMLASAFEIKTKARLPRNCYSCDIDFSIFSIFVEGFIPEIH